MSDTGRRDELIRLRPDRPANGGEAVGRVDGRVVFVRGAIPGELVTARITDDRQAGFRRAETVEVLEPSEHRVTPACTAALHGAGCCDLAFIDDAYARTLKGRIVADALTRIGGFGAEDLDRWGLDASVVRQLDSAVDDLGWRVRARLGVDVSGRPGFHAHRGAQIISGRRCAALDPVLQDVVETEGHQPGGDLVLVVDDRGRRHITAVAPPDPRVAGRGDGRKRAQARRRVREAPRDLRVIEGHDRAVHRVGEREWAIPVTGFWQAHRAAPTVYGRSVAEMIAAVGTDGAGRAVAWDLYGGAGVLAAALLDGGRSPESVHIVDSAGDAIEAAERTFGGDDRVNLYRGDVSAVLDSLPAPDVVVLDPPRTGAGRDVVRAVAAADPGIVVHVGCDIGRFARDLGYFVDEGYRVRELRAFDAFPQTHHVEAMACLVPAHRMV